MKLRVALFLLCGAVLLAGRAAAQVSVQVVPDNGSHPHPTARLINTSGHTVTFTVINTGTIDTRYAISCTRTGSVTSVSCSPTSPLIAEGDSRVITATFAVGSAGTGRITLTAAVKKVAGGGAVLGALIPRVIRNRILGKAAETFLKRAFGGGSRSLFTSSGWRMIDNLTAEGVAQEAKLGRTFLTSRIRSQIQKDVELLSTPGSGVTRVEWHFFPGLTGTGPSGPLRRALERAGITIVEHASVP